MGKNVHVVTHGKRWAVKEEGKKAPLSTHKSQELAREKAVPVAKKNESEVVIHGRDGRIRDKDSYGNDPNPPKDRKH
ncbi:MAG: DUF2188 domain-containing protein [Ignavibacteria bacterium]|nr:DUF2188 domain-containing protein [Ignavibacteria bacterium]